MSLQKLFSNVAVSVMWGWCVCAGGEHVRDGGVGLLVGRIVSQSQCSRRPLPQSHTLQVLTSLHKTLLLLLPAETTQVFQPRTFFSSC